MTESEPLEQAAPEESNAASTEGILGDQSADPHEAREESTTPLLTERKRAPYSRPGLRKDTEAKNDSEDSCGKNASSLFACRICLDSPSEPVVTRCGHLYCYECLMSWFEAQPSLESCPVCKSRCTLDAITPIYGGGREEKDPRNKPKRQRPRPQTTPAPPPRRPQTNGGPSDWFRGFPAFDWAGLGNQGNSNSAGFTFHAGFLPFPGLGVGFQIPFGGPNESSNRSTPAPDGVASQTPPNSEMINPHVFFLSRLFFLVTILILVSIIFG